MDFDEKAMWNRLTDNGNGFYTMNSEFGSDATQHMIKGILHRGPVLIEFVKSDGSIRAMNCTLSEQHGAVHKIVEAKETVNNSVDPAPAKVNQDVCRIWDIDQAAWRSFRWDRLKRIEFKIG